VNASLAEELLSLSEDDLEDLETVLVGAAPEFEEAAPRVLRLASGMDKVRASYYRRFEKLTADLERKAITLRQFEKEAHDLISTTFRDVYRTHRGRTLTPGDEEWLSRASAEELRYASKFGKDIDAGNLKMPRQRRAMLYAQTLNGIALNAKIEALPDNSRIWWRLGRGEHCIDCLILAANSPYTKWNLPTTPRSGDTRCVSNCLCKLEVNLGVLSRAEREDAAEYAQKRDQSLNDMLRPVKPPRGMRLAEPAELRVIDGLRMRMNLLRRRMAEPGLDPKELRKLAAERSRINAKLIDYLEERGIYDVPVWSVDDVLDERHVGRRAVQELFRHGIDGRSLSLVEKRHLTAMLDRYEKEVGELFSDEVI